MSCASREHLRRAVAPGRHRPRRDDSVGTGRGNRAFTLLELVLVMVLITVVLAAAAPNLRGFYQSTRLKNAAIQNRGGKLVTVAPKGATNAAAEWPMKPYDKR